MLRRCIHYALAAAKVTGEADGSGKAQKWTVTVRYLTETGETSSADIQFEGDTLTGYFSSSGTRRFSVTGLDALFTAADADVLHYLAQYRNAPLPDPVY